MNQLRIAGCTPGALEQAGNDILDRSLLWEVKNDNLWIKDKDKLVGIGGNIKQDKLTAGDNIEIIEEGENILGGDRKDTIRLKDNIEVHSCTISPGTEEDPILPWKGTIFLGELTDGNQVYLITKATQVKDEDQALFGGQILVKMTTKEGKDIYAQYALTITSTGSWSLWGGNNAGANIRVCKAKYKDEWYYGIKIPSGDFQNVKEIRTPVYSPAQTTTERTYIEVDTEGDLHLGFATRRSNAIKLTQGDHLGTLSRYPTVSRDVYSVKVRDLIDKELGLANGDWKTLTQRESAKENQWMKWYEDDASIQFILQNQRYKENAWNIANTSRDINLYKLSNINNQIGDFELYVDRGYDGWGQTLRRNDSTTTAQNQWIGANAQRLKLALREDGQAVFSSNDPDESELSAYNHWYSCKVQDFEWLLSFNFDNRGEWDKWTSSARYRLCFRIYNQGSSNNVRITRIQIRDTDNTSTKVKNTQGGVEGAILYDFKVTDPDAPFTWANNELVNLTQGVKDENGNVIAYPTYAKLPGGSSAVIGNFLDRIANPSAGRMSIKFVVESVTYPSIPDPKVLTPFDTDYLGLHTSEVNSFSSNKIPLFKPWANTGTAVLYYGGEDCRSFFGDFSAGWQAIDGFKVEQQYFIDNLNLDKTEIWYNGWYDLPDPLVPPQPPTSELEFQVLARESQDEDSFSEVFFSSEPITTIVNKIDGLQDLGEDAPPYKWVITERVLSLSDLKLLAAHIKNSDKQIYLDLSQCTVANNAKEWEGIFEGCVSLRGLVIPQGVTRIGNGCFIWCTYMRELDLGPSTSSLREIGGGSGWATSMGLLTSTRIRTVIVPKNVTHFSNYLVYSSNVENFITLYGAEFGPTVDSLLFKWGDDGWTSEWTWFGIKAGNSKIDELPDGFHLFFDIDFWESKGFVHGRGTSGSVYPGTSRWPQTVKNSIVTYNMRWGQKEWQEFNNKYHWGEDLINKVRRLKNPNVSDLEIIDYSYMQ